MEINFMKRLQPKLSKFRQMYSSLDFSKKVLEKWTLRSQLQISLSAIRNAIVAEVEDGDEVVDFDRRKVIIRFNALDSIAPNLNLVMNE
ncbi:digalactosyldiacylglycerol synthase 1 [Quercus suber]|uniref:Digalactosyldiacylglycerol synthase 1 n=1 Tax=Quercus suber TaxID=58331 RepID=A0AAW0JHW2_QUESU